MSKRMQQYRGDLHLIGGCTPNTRKAVFKACDNKLIEAIADAVWTVLEGKVPLTPSQRQHIIQEQPILRQIAAKNRTLKQKRKVLTSQRGGNIISFLFNALKSIF